MVAEGKKEIQAEKARQFEARCAILPKSFSLGKEKPTEVLISVHSLQVQYAKYSKWCEMTQVCRQDAQEQSSLLFGFHV